MTPKAKTVKKYRVSYESPTKSGHLVTRHLLVEASNEGEAMQIAGDILASQQKLKEWRTISAKAWL